MKAIKYNVGVIFIGCPLLIVFASGWLATAAAWVLGLILVAHLLEFIAKREVLANAPGSMGHHFIQTMIYGLFHWRPLEQTQKADH